MYYCFNQKEFPNHQRINLEIKYAIDNNSFIYYDEQEGIFKDQNETKIDVAGKKVFPSSFIFQLENMINALEKNGAIIPNSLEDIKKVEEWYKYFETNRLMISFCGKDLNDPEILNFILQLFQNNPEVFLKTKKKDFNGIIDLTELLDEESDLRKAFSYHEDEEFIISEKVEFNEDEIGKQEYRVLIYKGKVMNISCITDTIYHQIPEELIEYIDRLLTSIPKEFPKTFVLDIFSYQNMFDILEINPIEASGRYLYNSIFSFSTDLIHSDIEDIPKERYKELVTFEKNEELSPSTLKNVNGSFAKDYEDIKKYGKRIDGFVHIFGLPDGAKIDIDDLLSSLTSIEPEEKTDNHTLKKV